METSFYSLLLGHLAGDYLFQSKAMALGKTDKGWRGWSICIAHCVIYTLAVCVSLWDFRPAVMAIVFFSHLPIDRWSLASVWLKIINGRDIAAAYLSREKTREIDIAFSCLVYAVVDNTLHLILMWLALRGFL